MGDDVLTVVKMSMLVIWVVPPCGLVGRFQRFGGKYYLHLALKMEAIYSSETLVST
jgi:hypothetical protein